MRKSLQALIDEQQEDRTNFVRPEVITPNKIEDFDTKCERLFHYAINTLGFNYKDLSNLPRNYRTIKKICNPSYRRVNVKKYNL